MAIDLSSEEILTPAEAAKRCPCRRGGRPTHVSTVYRWMTRGVNGIRLEALRLGGGLVTSAEALQRFAERLTGSDAEPVVKTSRQRELAARRAEAELKAHGI